METLGEKLDKLLTKLTYNYARTDKHIYIYIYIYITIIDLLTLFSNNENDFLILYNIHLYIITMLFITLPLTHPFVSHYCK